jgi:hypothetical protein
MEPHDPRSRPLAINSNTYVSIGMLIVLVGAAWAILTQISDLKSTTNQIGWDVNDLKKRMSAREEIKFPSETWTDRDMLQWSVHLQKDNPSLRVPEPPMHLNNQ